MLKVILMLLHMLQNMMMLMLMLSLFMPEVGILSQCTMCCLLTVIAQYPKQPQCLLQGYICSPWRFRVQPPCLLQGYAMNHIIMLQGYIHVALQQTRGLYYGRNWRFRVWNSQKFKKMYFPSNRTRWDKYMLKDMSKYKFQGKSHLVRLEGKKSQQTAHCALSNTVFASTQVSPIMRFAND